MDIYEGRSKDLGLTIEELIRVLEIVTSQRQEHKKYRRGDDVQTQGIFECAYVDLV